MPEIADILRAQQAKPVEIDRFTDASLFWDVWLLLCIWAWGIGYSYGEEIMGWLKK